MSQPLSFLAIIPARGGSKGLPGKHLRPLCGSPLMTWTIRAARASRVNRILVSSDDPDIRLAADQAGAIPIVRPPELATDTSPMEQVIAHAMAWCEDNGWKADVLVYLQATCPLRTGFHIDEACNKLLSLNADAIVSVCRSKLPSAWSHPLPHDESMEHFVPQSARGLQRQQFQDTFHLTGAVHVIRWEAFQRQGGWYGPKTFAYIMDAESSVDIDTHMDFLLAEALLKERLEYPSTPRLYGRPLLEYAPLFEGVIDERGEKGACGVGEDGGG